MKEAIKCTCGRSEKIFCPNCSKLRMSILLKNGYDDLKYKRRTGELSNPVWYSHLKYNRQDNIDKIAQKMEERLRKNPQYAAAAQVLLFYVNGQRHQPIKKVIL